VVVRLLVDFGTDVKAKDNNGKTVLHSAASAVEANAAVVRLLMDLVADAKAKGKDRRTAF
jgi:ankyrin repeat protein